MLKRKLTTIFACMATICWAEEVKLNPIYTNAMGYQLDAFNRNIYKVDFSLISNQGYTNTTSAFKRIPFVTVQPGKSLDLRGQGNSSNMSVKVLLDGVQLSTLDASHKSAPIHTILPSEIESIEILPGGGAVMYGSGTRGGVINIITKKRYEEFNLELGSRLGSVPSVFKQSQDADFDIKVGGKVADSFYYTLKGAYQYHKGPQQNALKKAFNIGTSLIYDFSSTHTLGLDFNIYQDFQQTPSDLSSTTLPNKTNRYKGGKGSPSADYRYSAALNYTFTPSSDLKFDSKLFYYWWKNLQQNPKNLDPFKDEGNYFSDSKAGLQLKSEYKHSNGLLYVGLDNDYGEGQRRSFADANFKKFTSSIWVLDNYNFSSSFSLTGGARYEYAKFFGNKTNSKGRLEIDGHKHNLAIEITPKYFFEDGNDIYTKYERGFVSPTPLHFTSTPFNGTPYTHQSPKNEVYDTFELGGKLLNENNIGLSMALFYTLTQNEVYLKLINQIYEVLNFDLTQRLGVELALDQKLLDGTLILNHSFTYVDSKLLKNQNPKDKRGVERIPYVIDYKYTFNIDYKLNRNWNMSSNATFVGPSEDTNGTQIPSYFLADISVGYKINSLSLSAGINNIFDTLYYDNFRSGGGHGSSSTSYTYAFAPGRNIFTEVRYVF